MTLESLRELQDRESLSDRHLVSVDVAGDVTVVHTRGERALADAGGPPLDQCPITVWLTRYHTTGLVSGLYLVVRQLGGGGSSRYSLERAKVSV